MKSKFLSRCQLFADAFFAVKDLIDMGVAEQHGPITDPINSTDGGLVFLLNSQPDNPDHSSQLAAMMSPQYRNSFVDCKLEFWYYIAGDIGANGYMMPVLLTEEGLKVTPLDQLYPSTNVGLGIWRKSENGIGRQRGPFNIQISLEPRASFDAGVAIDDLGFVNCEQKPAEDQCSEGFFHCKTSKACVPNDQLCDLADQCGDNSDEELEICAETIHDTFEHDFDPLGIFTHNEDHSDFMWNRGAGIDEGSLTTGPPFDHTTFGPSGHYLFIRSSEHNKDERAQLITKPFKGNEDSRHTDPCTMYLWYYMHGEKV